MEQRLSLITLGVADLPRARRFYEAGLGWTRGNTEDEVAFYQLNGLVLALWTRKDLADDAHVTDTGATFSGMSLAFNTRSHDEVDEVLAQAEAAGGTILKSGEEQLGRLLRPLRRSGRAPVGGRLEPRLVDRRHRAHLARLGLIRRLSR